LSSNQELIIALKNPKQKDIAFGKLLDLYQERLYWHIRKIVVTHENADDVLQNTFVRIYRSIEKFQEKSSLLTWMYRIAYNESIRFVEKNKRFQFDVLEDATMNHFQVLQEDSYYSGDEIKEKLHAIVERLSEKQKRVFQMKYFDELSFREISEIMAVSESTLKSAYYAAVKIIEKKILE
jgi:RNA polymerase sigma-70 factor (ECF subfamily)